MSDSGVAFDRTIQLMQDRLSLNSVNQSLVSSNLANLNTPGYVAKETSFDQVLRDALEDKGPCLVRSSAKHFDVVSPEVAMSTPTTVETGPVDLDREMMKLTKNSIEYQFMVTMLNKKFSLIKQAIGEGAQ
jgi:flagellar basal-body rod protein FlgB